MIERYKPKKMDDKIFFLDGFLKVIYEDEYYQEIITPDWDKEIKKVSFRDILKRAGMKYKGGVVYIWLDDALSGEIWEFGNSDKKQWYLHAKTKGYA